MIPNQRYVLMIEGDRPIIEYRRRREELIEAARLDRAQVRLEQPR
jgi:hypothetical protein